MTFKIKKGRHRAWPLHLGLWFNKTTIEYDVFFHIDCKYHINGEDSEDQNKLFGIGYFPGHHSDSARFGWRYNPITNKIIISAYCYVKGNRIYTDLREVPLMRWTHMKLVSEFGKYIFYVNGELSINYIEHLHKKKWSFPLGVFFGGNRPAPHTMQIELRKIKP